MTSERVPGELVHGLTQVHDGGAIYTAVDLENIIHRRGKLTVLCTGRGVHKSKLVMRAQWHEAFWGAPMRQEEPYFGKRKPLPDWAKVYSAVGIVDSEHRVRFLPYIEADMSEEVKHKYPANVSTGNYWFFEVGIKFPGFEFECPVCKPRYSAKFSQRQLSKLVLQKLFITGQSRGPVELDISNPQDMKVHPALLQRFDEMSEGAELEAGLKKRRTRS